MTTSRAATLNDAIIAMGPNCTLSQKDVYEQLKDLTWSVDKDNKDPVRNAISNNNVEAINWLLDEKQHPKFTFSVAGFYVYLGLAADTPDEGLDSKDNAVLNRRKIIDLFVNKIWEQKKSVADRLDDFRRFYEYKQFAIGNVYAIRAITLSIEKYIIPDKTDTIIPFLSFLLRIATHYKQIDAVKYIVSVCKEKENRLHWLSALKKHLPNIVNYAMKTDIVIAKFLIEQDFSSNNAEDVKKETSFPLMILLELRKNNKITEEQALEMAQLIINKNQNNIYLSPIHLQLALQCQNNRELVLLLIIKLVKSRCSLQDMAQAGWKSMSQMADLHLENKITFTSYGLRNYERSCQTLVPLLLSDKSIKKTTLKTVIQQGYSFSTKEIEFALSTKDAELIQILFEEPGKFEMSWNENFPSMMALEMWKYPKFVAALIDRKQIQIGDIFDSKLELISLEKKYAGDTPLTHILRHLTKGVFSLQEAEILFDKFRNEKINLQLMDLDIVISSNNLAILKSIISYFPKTLELIKKDTSALIKAAELGNVKIVAFLLANDALAVVDKSYFGSEKWMPALIKGIECGHIEVVKLLIIQCCPMWNGLGYALRLCPLTDKEDSPVPVDTRWRIKTFITTACSIRKYLGYHYGEDKYDFGKANLANPADEFALCYFKLWLGLNDSEWVSFKKQFPQEMIQKAQQLIKDKNLLQSIYDEKSEQIIAKPSAPSEVKDSEPVITKQCIPSAPHVAEDKPKEAPSAQPASIPQQNITEQKPQPKHEEEKQNGSSLQVPQTIKEDAVSTEGQNNVANVSIAPVHQADSVLKIANACEQPRLPLSTANQDDIQSLSPRKPSNVMSLPNVETSNAILVSAHIASADPKVVQREDACQPLTNPEPVQEEGQPGLLTCSTASSDEQKFIPLNLLNSSHTFFQPTHHADVAQLNLKSDKQFFRNLFEMTRRDRVWDGNEQLKLEVQRFCAAQLKQLTSKEPLCSIKKSAL